MVQNTLLEWLFCSLCIGTAKPDVGLFFVLSFADHLIIILRLVIRVSWFKVRPKKVAPPPVPGNLTRTKTILATDDSPAMVDIAMPATVKSWNVSVEITLKTPCVIAPYVCMYAIHPYLIM